MTFVSVNTIPDDNEISIVGFTSTTGSKVRHSIQFGGVHVLLTDKGLERLAFEVRCAQDGGS